MPDLRGGIAILALFLVAGCGSSAAAPTATPKPTATHIPPTSTPEPVPPTSTPKPVPTATPARPAPTQTAPTTLGLTVEPYEHADPIQTQPFTAPHGFDAHYMTACRVEAGTTLHPGGQLAIIVQPGGSKDAAGMDEVDIAMIQVGASDSGAHHFSDSGYLRLLVSISKACQWSIRVTD